MKFLNYAFQQAIAIHRLKKVDFLDAVPQNCNYIRYAPRATDWISRVAAHPHQSHLLATYLQEATPYLNSQQSILTPHSASIVQASAGC